MNRNAQRVALARGYLLHQRPFRDTSLIVEVYTREHGRMSCFARAARGPRSRFSGLRPFQPLLLSWSGRGDAPQLTGAECDGLPAALPSAQLLSAFYLNELLIKLTAQHDPHPELFDLYDAALAALAALADADGAQAESVLRHFELRLLELLGFGVDLQFDAGSGAPVRADAYYHFRPGSGLLLATEPQNAIPGVVLQSLARDEALTDPQQLRAARSLMRAAIDHCLEGRELATRTVARAMAKLERIA